MRHGQRWEGNAQRVNPRRDTRQGRTRQGKHTEPEVSTCIIGREREKERDIERGREKEPHDKRDGESRRGCVFTIQRSERAIVVGVEIDGLFGGYRRVGDGGGPRGESGTEREKGRER